MNWRRGLFRLWLVVSIVWASPWLVIAFSNAQSISEYQDSIASMARSPSSVKYRELLEPSGWVPCFRTEVRKDNWVQVCDSKLKGLMPNDLAVLDALKTKISASIALVKKNQLDMYQLAFLPPFGVLLAGVSLYWALSGFRQRSKPDNSQ